MQHLQEAERGPVNHRIEMFTLRGFSLNYLKFVLIDPPAYQHLD